MKRPLVLAVTVALLVAGCAGAGLSTSPGSAGKTRCGSSAADEQRPLFFVFCVESP